MLATLNALAEPNRLRIVELLRAGPRAVNDIRAELDLNQPQVSKHLRVLKQAGLVSVRPRAQQRVYALRAAPLAELHGWLEGYRELWAARLDELDELVQELAAEEARQLGKPRTKSRKRYTPSVEGLPTCHSRARTQKLTSSSRGSASC